MTRKEFLFSRLSMELDDYTRFVVQCFSPEELWGFATTRANALQYITGIVPFTIKETHNIHRYNNITFFVPKDITIVKAQKNRLKEMTLSPEKHNLKNPMFVTIDKQSQLVLHHTYWEALNANKE